MAGLEGKIYPGYAEMTEIKFTIPGQPRGYTATTRWTLYSPRVKKYREWKKYVLDTILASGIKAPIPTKERPLILIVKAYYSGGHIYDPENVAKGVADVLWENDRHTGRIVWPPLYDKVNPRIEVAIKSGEILEEVE